MLFACVIVQISLFPGSGPLYDDQIILYFYRMVSENLYQPFEVEYKEVTEGVIAPHKHNFFEMVYLMEGTGIQCLNKNRLPYAPEKLFLLMPQDCHSFEVVTPTSFFFIRFNNIYIQNQQKEWIRQLEFIFQHNSHLPGCVLKNPHDKPLVRSLITAIMKEQEQGADFNRTLVQQLVNTIITVVARNISPSMIEQRSETSKDILHYIHEHIYSPEKIRAEQIAGHFNISPKYLSEYFRRNNGDSLQQYITNYKLKLVETRLQFSEMRIGEIADELGFTDESHLNRIFKKYKGISPSLYRKELLVK